MQTLTQPTLLLKPFAESGDKNTLPDVNTDLTNPQRADLTDGFPQITSLPPANGGLPPERKDFNALGYLTTTYDFFYQAGGTFTFSPTISTAIGGYPLNARLWYTNSSGQSMILRSTVQNNTDNFNDGNETGIGTSWVVESFIGVGLNEGYVSNCITKIQEDIKVEVVAGGFTLKAGSTYYMPDGTAHQTASDIIKTGSIAGGASRVLVCVSESGTLRYRNLDACVSGANVTTVGGFVYNTTTNKVEFYDATGIKSSDDNSLPIMILQADSSGTPYQIEKIFNGAGYIGHHAFVLPGVSFLRADGKNADGTLASTKYTRNSVFIIELNSSSKCISILNGGTGVELLQDYISVKTYNDLITDYSIGGRILQYVIDDNMAYRMDSGSPHALTVTRRTLLVRYSYDGTSVTQFDIEPVVRMATQEDVDSKQDKNTAMNYGNMSFCITKIPQNINMEIQSGALVLKAGSIITGSDGTQMLTTIDRTRTPSSSLADGKYYVFPAISSTALQEPTSVSAVGSGTTLPADNTDYSIFFYNTDSKIYRWYNNQWTAWGVGLPIAIITMSGGAVVSIDKVFNGVGYIAMTVFALPGIEILSPAGKNADGTLKSNLYKKSSVTFYRNSTERNGDFVIMTSTGGLGSSHVYINEDKTAHSRVYVPSENMSYNNRVVQSFVPIIKFSSTTTAITKFESIQPMHAVDYKDLYQSNNDFTGINTVPTPATTDNSKQIANTEFVKNAIEAAGTAPRDVTVLWGDGSAQNPTSITLSEPFTNFEKIGVYIASDNLVVVSVYIHDTYWLNRVLNGTSHYVLIGQVGSDYWSIRNYHDSSNPSTTTKFVTGSENSLLVYIYGINRISS